MMLCGISEVNDLSYLLSDSRIYLRFLGSQILMIFLAFHVIASLRSLAFGPFAITMMLKLCGIPEVNNDLSCVWGCAISVAI